MEWWRARARDRGGEDVPALRENGTRIATASAAVFGLGLVAAAPLARASGSLQSAGVRISAIALVVLVAALVLGWTPLVPVAITAVGGLYAAQLVLDDESLDASAPLIAAGLLLVAELAYWSLEEQERVQADPGDDLRHAAFVGVLGIGALAVGGLLLALVDVVQTEGLAVDVVGAIAASSILAAVLVAGRSRGRSGP